MLKFMIKTALVGALATGATVALVGPDKVEDWVFASKQAVEEKINELQGMTAELRRVEARVERLDREIAELKEHALREELEIETLEEEIDHRESAIDYLRDNLEKAHTLLGTDLDRFNIRGITYGRTEIEQDVEEKMRLFQVQEDTLAQLRMTHNTRKNALELARENVTRGQAVREELIGTVRLMQAKLEKFKARQVYAEAVTMDFDAQEFNTEIGEARKSLASFEKKLEVKNRLLEEQLKVAASGNSVVSGIDYTKTAKADVGIQEQLSELLFGTTTDTSELAAAGK